MVSNTKYIRINFVTTTESSRDGAEKKYTMSVIELKLIKIQIKGLQL